MEVLKPSGIYEEFSKKGKTKAENPWWKILLQGVFAGAYIGFGGVLAITVGGSVQGLKDGQNLGLAQWIFGAVFPFGLIMVESTGAELFTGNAAYLVVAVLEGKATLLGLLKNWSFTYLGNFIGSVLLSLLFFNTETMSEPGIATAVAIAEKKIHSDFGTQVLKGMMCNWLVCIALWQSAGCKDFASKVMASWLPVSAFVTMGFEHSVANMLFIPLGIHFGAEVTWGDLVVKNLIPVTLGNIVGGSFVVAGCYSLAFGKPGNALQTFADKHFGFAKASKHNTSPSEATASGTLAHLDLERGSS